MEHNHVGALVEGHTGEALDLGALFVDDHVVDVTLDQHLVGWRRCGGGSCNTQSQQQGHQGCGEEELFEGGLGSNHGVDLKSETAVSNLKTKERAKNSCRPGQQVQVVRG